MISIAMTTYNGEKYLREQLDSILNQTYKDFELIICDDCSSDSTVQILNEYEKKDNRIKIFVNEENLGFKKNFEKAISLCRGGGYIAFSDQDDVWNPDKLELSLRNIGENSLLCTNAELTDSELNSLGYTMNRVVVTPTDFTNKNELLKLLVHKNFVQGCTILAKSNFIKKYLPIPKEIIFHDWYYAVCAILESKNITERGIIYINDCTIKYRQHISSISENKKRALKNDIRIVTYDIQEIKKNTAQSLYFIELIKSKSQNDSSLTKYLDDSKKYFLAFPEKKFYTLIYLNKYFDYVYSKTNFISKRIILFKRFLGIIRYKLFIKHYKNNSSVGEKK